MSELLDPGEMAIADRRPSRRHAGITLMDRAGAAVADVVARRPLTSRVLVLCGPATMAATASWPPASSPSAVSRAPCPARKHRGASRAMRRWPPAAGRDRWDAVQADLSQADLIVDALFRRRPRARSGRRCAGARGADGRERQAGHRRGPALGRRWRSTGAVRGAAAPAVETVTFFRRKPGHLLLPGRGLCGKVRVADIGIRTACSRRSRRAPAPMTRTLGRAFPGSRPSRDTNTGAGHAVVMSGGRWTAGAARLAARGCLRAGAGLVTVACPEGRGPRSRRLLCGADGPARGRTAAISAISWWIYRYSSVVLGPGLGVGDETRDMVEAAVASIEPRARCRCADELCGAPQGLAERIAGAKACRHHAP